MFDPVAVIVFTDGRRECISQTIPSLRENVRGNIVSRTIFDDSGDRQYYAWLQSAFPDFEVVHWRKRSGFSGTYHQSWKFLQSHIRPEVQFIFSTEDDFLFNLPVELQALIEALRLNPDVLQIVLKRQPWNDQEKQAGGIIEQHPDDYEQRANLVAHRKFWSTNPHLTRRSILEKGWPNIHHSEGIFTHQLLEDPTVRFAFWGQKDDPPRVHHIGAKRVGNGY